MQRMTSIERYGFKKGKEEGLEKGIEKGIEQGIGQGIDIGMHQLFRKLLETKFGPLNNDYIKHIQKLSSEEIENMLVVVVHAQCIQDVFEDCASIL